MDGKDSADHILYELYVYCEWKPEPEFSQTKDIKDAVDPKSFLHWLRLFGPQRTLLESMLQWKEKLQRWQIAITNEGKLLAVLADNILEIRTKRAEYSTIVARTTLARDAFPQLRKLVWSPDCSLLAVAHSNGTVAFYDLTASNLYNIPADCLQPAGQECKDTTHALSSIVFIAPRQNTHKWSWEVLLLTYNGKLRCYLVSQLDGNKLYHKFTFECGASVATYSPSHNLICLAGPRSRIDNKKPKAADFGLTCWRVLNDAPYYKLSVASDQFEYGKPNRGLTSFIPFVTQTQSDYMCGMRLSHNEDMLVCNDTAGEITVWKLPALQLIYRWRLEEQYSIMNSVETIEIPNNDLKLFAPVDISWWDDERVIIARANGLVSVCKLSTMNNYLGKKSGQLEGTPQVTNSFDKLFLAFESESKTLSGNRNQAGEVEEDTNTSTALVKPKYNFYMELAKELMKSLLYNMTDLEMFQPKPKKIFLVSRIYRLLCIKSTTPDELYARKITNGKYEEALELAKKYNLDSDLVYQQQWRKSAVSHRTIRRYLAKVSKKIWSVQQCVDRVAETLQSAKELLEFGLNLSDQEILYEVKMADSTVHCLDAVRADHLNANSSELLRCRHLMLFYLQRLHLYEEIIKCEKGIYVREEYDRLRSNSLAHCAHEYAKEGRTKALKCLWPQIRNVSLQLSILGNLPETMEPTLYENLLPTHDKKNLNDGRGDETQDWSLRDTFKSVWQSTVHDDLVSKDLDAQETQSSELSKWFVTRCESICRLVGLVTHAKKLAHIGNKNGLNLHKLIFDLSTLEMLIYEVGLEEITLDKLKTSSVLDVCNMIFNNMSDATFISDMKEFIVPYLKSYSRYTERDEDFFEQFAEFLAELSKKTLKYAFLVLKESEEFDLSSDEHLILTEKCLFSYEGMEDISKAYEILETIPKTSKGKILPAELLKRLSDLEKYIWAWDILSLHSVNTTLQALKLGNAPSIQSLTHMARNMALRENKAKAEDWNILLTDMLDLCEKIFVDVDTQTCYQIYASAILTSGDITTIKMASEILTVSKSELKNVPYDDSLKCILNSAKEYFNSAPSLCAPGIELARSCLMLIKEEEKTIIDELDLISALAILNEFGLTIIPIQVRLCVDKMELIDQCLNSSRTAYTASYKLLKLAQLLKISPDDENKREGIILTAVGNAAMASGDSASTLEAARRLAALRYAPSASLLRAAAALPAPAAPNVRRELLAAAALFSHDLVSIVTSRLQLEMDELEKQFKFEEEMCNQYENKYQSFDSNEEEYADAVTTPIAEPRSIFAPSNVEEGLSKLGSMITDNAWQEKLNLKNWFKRKQTDQTLSEDMQSYNEFDIHTQEFYATLYSESKVSKDSYDYSTFAGPDCDSFYDTSILRALLLHYQLDGSKCDVAIEKVKDCISWSWKSDATLATSLAVLTARYSKDDSLDKNTPILTQLYSALLLSQADELKDEVFLTRPAKLLKNFYEKYRNGDVVKPEFKIVEECVDKLWRRWQAEQFGLNISDDSILKDEDTLIQLASESKLESVEAAIKLYEGDSSLLWYHHFEACLLKHSDEMHPNELRERVTHKALTEALSNSHYLKRISDEIWPKVDGTNHNILQILMYVMRNIDPNYCIENIPVQVHIKFIKKVRATSNNLDYKRLIKCDKLLEHLLEISNAENVSFIAKLLRAMPTQIQIDFTPQDLYSAWLPQYFFSVGESSPSCKKWMQQFRQCFSFFSKLPQNRLLDFINEAVFSLQAVTRIPWNTRRLMLQQCIEYCQLEDKQILNHSYPGDGSWNEAWACLTDWEKFLERFHSPKMQKIIESYPEYNDIWVELEMGNSRREKIEPVFRMLILDSDVSAIHLSDVYQNAGCYEMDEDLLKIIGEGVLDERIITRLSQLCSKCTNPSDIATKLLSKQPPAHIRKILLPMCSSKDLPKSEDTSVLLQHSLDIIHKEFDLMSLSIEELHVESFSNEDTRCSIFKKLLTDCDSWSKRSAFVELVNYWVAGYRNEDNMKSIVYDFVKMLLNDTIDNLNENVLLLKRLLEHQQFTPQEVNTLIEPCTGHNLPIVFRFILLSKHDAIIDEIPNIIRKHENTMTAQVELEDDVIEDLLKKDFLPRLVNTKAYTSIIYYLLNNNLNDLNISWAVRELLKVNMFAEAGQLSLLQLGVPSALRSFTGAVLLSRKK